MRTVSTIGLDIANSVFQVHGGDPAAAEASLCSGVLSEAIQLA